MITTAHFYYIWAEFVCNSFRVQRAVGLLGAIQGRGLRESRRSRKEVRIIMAAARAQGKIVEICKWWRLINYAGTRFYRVPVAPAHARFSLERRKFARFLAFLCWGRFVLPLTLKIYAYDFAELWTDRSNLIKWIKKDDEKQQTQ